jgi:hypothetical protein
MAAIKVLSYKISCMLSTPWIMYLKWRNSAVCITALDLMLIFHVPDTLKKPRVLLLLKCMCSKILSWLAQHFNFFNVCTHTLRFCEVRDNLIDKRLSYFSGSLIFQNTAVYWENDQHLYCPSALKFRVSLLSCHSTLWRMQAFDVIKPP